MIPLIQQIRASSDKIDFGDPVEFWKTFQLEAPPYVKFVGNFDNAIMSHRLELAYAPSIRASAGYWFNIPMCVGHLIPFACKCREGTKDGLMFTQGRVNAATRKIDTMGSMFMVGADVDSGFPMGQAVQRVQELGWFACFLPSYSYGTSSSHISYGDFRAFHGSDDWAAEDIRAFLRKQGKLTQEVIQSVTEAVRVREGRKDRIKFRHAPIEKYRIIIVLEIPFEPTAYDTPAAWNAAWGKLASGMSVLLQIAVDPACKDISRAFYFSAKPKGATDRPVYIVGGRLVTIQELAEAGQLAEQPSAPKIRAKRKEPEPQGTAPASPRQQASVEEVPVFLKKWAAKHARQFRAASAIEFYTPALLGHPAKGGLGKHFVCCPMSERHSDPYQDDSASFVCDANDTRGFEVRCMHGSCINTDRLLFLNRLIETAALPRDALTDPRFTGATKPPLEVSDLYIGDGPLRGGFCGPIEMRLSMYVDRAGRDADITTVFPYLREAIRSARRHNRTDSEIERYCSDEFLNNLANKIHTNPKVTAHE